MKRNSLGGCITEYRKSWTMPIILLLILAFSAILILGADRNVHGQLAPLLGALALLSPVLCLALDRMRYRVALHERGLVQQGLLGRGVVMFDVNLKIWQKVFRESINGIPAGTHINLDVADRRQRIRLRSSVIDLEDLQCELERIESNLVLPAAWDVFQQGKMVDFDVFKLKSGTLFYKSKALPTDQIEYFSIQAGYFGLHIRGKRFAFCRVEIARIANLRTFLALLQHETGYVISG